MDEQRIEQALRQGPPFATAYVARPLPIDAAGVEHRGLTARRLAIALLTAAIVLAVAVAALAALGLLRGADPGPLVIIRLNVVWAHPTDGSPETEILPAVPDGSGGLCPDASSVPVGGSICGLVQHLAMSADGRRIVLSVYRTQPSQASESDDLYVLKGDGSGLRLVHHEPTGQFDFALAPDGHRLAYAAGPPQATGTRMGIIDLDSSEAIALPDGGTPLMWSPDGQSIAYSPEGDPASADQTWVVDASGKDPRFVGNGHPLAWTADSRSLFVSRSTVLATVPPELVAIDPSTKPASVWNLGATDSLAPSPDGRKVAIVETTDRAGQIRIVLSDRDGSAPVVISPIKADGARLCWSTDGRWLFWLTSHNVSPEADFVAYDIADGSTRTLAHAHTTSERAIYAPGCG